MTAREHFIKDSSAASLPLDRRNSSRMIIIVVHYLTGGWNEKNYRCKTVRIMIILQEGEHILKFM